MAKTYKMVGVCPIDVGDGRWINPESGEFSADLSNEKETFLKRIGAIIEIASVAPTVSSENLLEEYVPELDEEDD